MKLSSVKKSISELSHSDSIKLILERRKSRRERKTVYKRKPHPGKVGRRKLTNKEKILKMVQGKSPEEIKQILTELEAQVNR